MKFIIRCIVNAFALWVVTLIPALGVQVTPFAPGETGQQVLSFLAIAAVFAVVNTVLGSIVRVIAFPLYILTLGLISFVINGFLLVVTAWITGFWGWGLTVESFWLGVLASILISLINAVFGAILRPQSTGGRKRSRDRS